jgi:hypothetical protein
MQVVNQTPLVARVDTSEVAPDQPRIGVLTAKATFRFDVSGHVELESQEPLPLFFADQAAPLGLFPSDIEPRRDPVLEVILLGQAHAPRGYPVESMVVAMSVGEVRRELVVTGDRAWVISGDSAPFPTRPLPFTSLPLTYERAFGGKQLAQIDAASEFEVFDPINPHGRGFDAASWARGFGDVLRAPPGYPRFQNYRRELPNLEHPAQRIHRWEDSPEPFCWATMPRDVTLHAFRRAQRLSGRLEDNTKMPERDGPLPFPDLDEALYRGHPDWIIAIPSEAPLIRLSRLVDERALVEFRLLDQRVVADYVINGRDGSRALLPQRLIIEPDQRRFSLLYRTSFTFGFERADERGFRLRLEPSWFGGPA